MGLSESQYKYVENKTDFDNVDSSSIEYLFGKIYSINKVHVTEIAFNINVC